MALISNELCDFLFGPGELLVATGAAGNTCRARKRRASTKVLQCGAVAVDDEDTNENGDEGDEGEANCISAASVNLSSARRERARDDGDQLLAAAGNTCRVRRKHASYQSTAV